MFVKIISCKHKEYWYAKLVGEVVNVSGCDGNGYYVERGGYRYYIDKEDTEELS